MNPSFTYDEYAGNTFSNGLYWNLLIDDTGYDAEHNWDIDYYIPVFPSLFNKGNTFGKISISEFVYMVGVEILVAFIPLKGLLDDIRDSIWEPDPIFRWLARLLLPLSIAEVIELAGVGGVTGFVGTFLSKIVHGIGDYLKRSKRLAVAAELALKAGKKLKTGVKSAPSSGIGKKTFAVLGFAKGASEAVGKAIKKVSDFFSFRDNQIFKKIAGLLQQAVKSDDVDKIAIDVAKKTKLGIAKDIFKKSISFVVKNIFGFILRLAESIVFPHRAIINLFLLIKAGLGLGKNLIKFVWKILKLFGKVFNGFNHGVGEWLTRRIAGIDSAQMVIRKEAGETFSLTNYVKRGADYSITKIHESISSSDNAVIRFFRGA